MQKPLILTHKKLGFKLPYRIQHNADHNQYSGTGDEQALRLTPTLAHAGQLVTLH